MDVAPISDQHPASDDQELAKVLAGVDEQASKMGDTADPTPATTPSPSGLQFEETPLTGATPADVTATSAPTSINASDVAGVTDSTIAPVENEEPLQTVAPANSVAAGATPSTQAMAPVADSSLEGIKKDALEELRPLVTKLDLPADEKFDTMLLIIRSTDDKSLVQPAYDTAKQIADETKRAEALLDIIKEIDYFSAPGK